MSHGGSRPPLVASDGRFAPNRIVPTEDEPSHHLISPGAWMPHASVLEPEDEIRAWFMYPATVHFSETADEDLMPWELTVKQGLLGS